MEGSGEVKTMEYDEDLASAVGGGARPRLSFSGAASAWRSASESSLSTSKRE